MGSAELSEAALLERAVVECRRALPPDGCLVDALTKHLGLGGLELGDRLSRALGIEVASAAEMCDWQPRLDHRLVADAQRYGVLPVQNSNGESAAFARDPWNVEATTWLSELGRGPLPLLLVPASCLQHVFDTLRSQQMRAPDQTQSSRVSDSRTSARSTSDVVNFVDEAIQEAWRAGASDIHFETHPGGLRLLFRVDGVLTPTGQFADLTRTAEVISRIKVLAKLDITERRVPQDGRFRATLHDRSIDMRVSVMPCVYGEDAVLRLLDKAQLRAPGAEISLEGLGFDPDTLVAIRRLATRPHGMLLVTGPTGSGKTTTLYAVLSQLRTGQEKVVTIEDPVEYELPGVLQVPVDERKGLTFARGLRSILRHDPDKILIGEIRDAETAEIAIQSALTGHLVYTTVHANNVFDVIGRFVHMNVDLPSLLSALNGVVAQRLVRLVCRSCGSQRKTTEEEMSLFQVSGLKSSPSHVAQANGCAECRQTGYRGRTAVGEALILDDAIRQAIARRASFTELRDLASKRGVIALETRTLLLAAEGRTTVEEIDRVVGVR